MRIAANHAAIVTGSSRSHSTVQRIAAPNVIEAVVLCHDAYSVATWSARARASSSGAIAARLRIWSCLATGECFHADSTPRERGDRLGARFHVEPLQNRTDVYFEGRPRQLEIAADELVRFALHEQRQDIRLARREAERTGGDTHTVTVGRQGDVGRQIFAAFAHEANGVEQFPCVRRLGDEAASARS